MSCVRFRGAVYREARDSGTLRDSDKAVIRAFADQKPLSNRSKLLGTDGQILEKYGLGGQEVAHWEDGVVVIDAVMDVRSTQAVLRYLRKVVPSKLLRDRGR